VHTTHTRPHATAVRRGGKFFLSKQRLCVFTFRIGSSHEAGRSAAVLLAPREAALRPRAMAELAPYLSRLAPFS
jgi:hypothetical protein